MSTILALVYIVLRILRSGETPYRCANGLTDEEAADADAANFIDHH